MQISRDNHSGQHVQSIRSGNRHPIWWPRGLFILVLLLLLFHGGVAPASDVSAWGGQAGGDAESRGTGAVSTRFPTGVAPHVLAMEYSITSKSAVFSQPIPASSAAPGALKREVFTNIRGFAVRDLTGNAKYPHSPDSVDLLPLFESEDLGDFYGQRLSGYLRPPVSGDYVFYLAADDNAELWLSLNQDPAGRQLIVSEPEWNLERNWLGQIASWDSRVYKPGRASPSIRLEGGKFYYIEALQKEHEGGGHVSVAWQLPGGPAPANGSEPISPPHLFAAIPNQAPTAIPGGPYTVALGEDLPLSAAGSSDPDAGDGIVSYAWDLNDDGLFGDQTGARIVVSTAYGSTPFGSAGTRQISLRVTDSFGATAIASTTLTVTKGTPVITWAEPSPILSGTALTSAQLNATASVPGTFLYSPPAGTVLTAGTLTLTTVFTPTDSSNYHSVSFAVNVTALDKLSDLSGRKVDSGIELQWTGAAPLLMAETVIGPWNEIGSARSPFLMRIEKPAFFRLAGTTPTVAAIPLRLEAGYTWLSFPLWPQAPDEKTVSSIFQGAPDGLTLYRFEGDQPWEINTYTTLLGWQNPQRMMRPGEGFVVESPARFSTLWIGLLPQGTGPSSLKLSLPKGMSLIAAQIPQPGALLDLQFYARTGDRIHQWDPLVQGFKTYFFDPDFGWEPSMPLLHLGEAFVLESAGTNLWERSFTVDQE